MNIHTKSSHSTNWRRRVAGLGVGVGVTIALLLLSYLVASVPLTGQRGNPERWLALGVAYIKVGGVASGILIGYMTYMRISVFTGIKWLFGVIAFVVAYASIAFMWTLFNLYSPLPAGWLGLLIPAGITAYLVGWPGMKRGSNPVPGPMVNRRVLLVRMAGLIWYVVVCETLGMVGGFWLDKLAGTERFFYWLGMVLGGVIAFWGLYKMVRVTAKLKAHWPGPLRHIATYLGAIIGGFAGGAWVEGFFRPPDPTTSLVMIFVAVVSGVAIWRAT